jgi:uncharacterized delta-60 repeat protein
VATDPPAAKSQPNLTASDGFAEAAADALPGTVAASARPVADGHPGDLDVTFGDSGRITTANLGEAHAAALQPDGKIVVVGYTAEVYGKISLARYNDDGSLDAGFGSSGLLILDFGPSGAQAGAVALQTDGKIVVVGNAYPDGFAVVRLNADGTLDPAFGQGGRVLTPIADHEGAYARAVVVQADGRIVVGGRAGLMNQDSVLVRHQPDGTLDASFGSSGDGVVFTDFEGGFDEIFAICIQDDGKIVAVGRTASAGAKLGDFGLARYTSDGLLDESFGNGGKVSTDFSHDRSFTDDCGYAATVLANGQIIVAGTTGDDWSRDAALARYNANGDLDTTFGEEGTGRVAHDFGTGYEKTGLGAQQFDEVLAVVAQADGRCVIAGSTQPAAGEASSRDFLVARYDASGRLDESFGDGGVVTTDFGGRDAVRALIRQPDERIVAVGHTAVTEQASFALARYLNLDRVPEQEAPPQDDAGAATGESSEVAETAPDHLEAPTNLDPTFNERGVVFAPFGSDPGDARALCIQPDGRVIVVGAVGATNGETPRDVAVVRFLPDGSLDDEFGSRGYALIDISGSDDIANAVALQADDKIVVAGEALDIASNSLDFALIRLNPDGHVDTSFNETGFVLTDFLGGTDDRAYAVAIQDDGKIVAAGYTTRPEGVPEKKRTRARKPKSKPRPKAGDTLRSEYFALARYNEDGSLDETFGTQGLVITPFEGDLARAEALVLQPTGEIVAAGFARSSPEESATDFGVVRYRSDGSLDESFGKDGLVLIDLEKTDDTAHAISLQEDGRIVLAGTAADKAANEVHFALVRLDAEGKLDSTFSGGGIALTNSFMGAAYGVEVEPDGSILAAGYGTVAERDMFAVVRYRSDGSLDSAFGVDGVMLLDLGGVIDRANAISLDAEGKILVAGTSRTVDKTEVALARLLGGSSTQG